VIVCPKCGAESSVTETRATPAGARRRRRCAVLTCDHRFTTLELVVHGAGSNKAGAIGGVTLVPTQKLRKLTKLVESITVSERVPGSWQDVWKSEQEGQS
jgi:hypothetical protein